jgi:hypothetical protein
MLTRAWISGYSVGRIVLLLLMPWAQRVDSRGGSDRGFRPGVGRGKNTGDQ